MMPQYHVIVLSSYLFLYTSAGCGYKRGNELLCYVDSLQC